LAAFSIREASESEFPVLVAVVTRAFEVQDKKIPCPSKSTAADEMPHTDEGWKVS